METVKTTTNTSMSVFVEFDPMSVVTDYEIHFNRYFRPFLRQFLVVLLFKSRQAFQAVILNKKVNL